MVFSHFESSEQLVDHIKNYLYLNANTIVLSSVVFLILSFINASMTSTVKPLKNEQV